MLSTVFLTTIFFSFFSFSHNFDFPYQNFDQNPYESEDNDEIASEESSNQPVEQRYVTKNNQRVKKSKRNIQTNYFETPSGQLFRVKSLNVGPKSELISIGNDDYDVTFRGAMREIESVNPKEETHYVENYPSQHIQSSGAGIRSPYPLTVGGVPFSPLSYPFGVDVSSNRFRIPVQMYQGEPQVYDPQHTLHDSEDNDLEIDTEFTSRKCKSLKGKEKKNCITAIDCSRRTSCFDCTYDLKCFWCSSTKACYPSRFFAKDSFTGAHCPASDMYYFQTCRIKSFIVMFVVIILLLLLFFGAIIFIFALIWRRSRRTKVYNIIKTKEDEMKGSYNESLVD